MPQTRSLVLTITAGPDKGRRVHIDQGTCKVMGRPIDEEQTVLTNRELELNQDDIQRIVDMLGMAGDSQSTTAQPFGDYVRADDVILHDNAISRVHVVAFYGQGAGILDIGSTNGTFVNSDQIEVKELNANDKIEMGSTTFTVAFE